MCCGNAPLIVTVMIIVYRLTFLKKLHGLLGDKYIDFDSLYLEKTS